MSTAINQLKKEKRRFFLAKIRDEQTQKGAFEKASKRLSDLLVRLSIWQKSLIIASYRALSSELSVDIFQRKYQHKCRFVFPRMREKEQRMVFVSADLDKSEDWEQSPWPGVWQPSEREETPFHKIDVFLVPAIAFDREGRRLGRGKGCYDRTLSQAVGIKIGMGGCYQISNEDFPEEEHDIRMDAVVTDRFMFVPLKYTRIFT